MRPRPRHLRLTAGLLSALGVATAAQSTSVEENALRALDPRVVETVSELAGEPESRAGRILAVEFADETAELFHVLASLQFHGHRVYVSSPEVLPEAKPLILAAFGFLGRDVTLACLDQLASSGSGNSTPQCLAALDLIRLFDQPEDYFHLARFVDRDSRSELHPLVEDELVHVFAEAFARSTRVRERFADEWMSWSEGMATVFVRASVRVGLPEAHEELVLLLGYRGDLDSTLLFTLAASALQLPHRAQEWGADFVARSLWEDDVRLLRAAVSATARFPSGEVIRPLVTLLSHEDTGVRLGAHRALRRQTGLGFPPNPRMWNLWLQEQEQWYGEEASEVLSRLSSTDRGDVTRAIRRIALHQLHREELAVELVVTLFHPDAYVRRAGCEALSSMNAWAATADLIEALEDEEPDVRAAAHEALARITGQSLPRDSEAWDQWRAENEQAPAKG